MATNEPMWRTLLEAASALGETNDGTFTWSEVISKARTLDPSHHQQAYGATFQSMVIESPTASTSPVGKVFTRISRGKYTIAIAHPDLEMASIKLFPESVARSITLTPKQVEGRRRAQHLGANFGVYVAHFSTHVPLTKAAQYQFHRRTIDLRRELGSAEHAIEDDRFVDSLYETLQAWGNGRRRSNLVSSENFATALRTHLPKIVALDALSIEDPWLDVEGVASRISELIGELGVVNNSATIVPGTMTLHHILPDLVVPLNREWSGQFFQWRPHDVQNPTERTFTNTFTVLAHVGAQVTPSRLLNEGWNSSSSKVLDNAVIGFCQLELVERGSPTATESDVVQRLTPQLSFGVTTSTTATVPRHHWYQFWRSTRS